jgi:hypothetical protein
MFAASPVVLADLGIAQRKPRLRSLPEKALAASKALATRVARHTMGSRAKAAVHGAVVEVATPAAPGPSQALALNGGH